MERGEAMAEKISKKLDRRRFLSLSAFLAGGAMTWNFRPVEAARFNSYGAQRLPGVVARVHDPGLRKKGRRADPDRMLALLDRAMQTLFDRDTPKEAWQQVVRPGEVVGLKVNCIAGRGNATSHELVDAVVERLQEAGIKPGNIVIWDRLNSDLEDAGYKIQYNRNRVRCFGNDAAGFDPNLYVYGSAGSLVTRTLTEICDAVINLPVLKDHGIVGVTLSLKNLFGAIHNPNKYHVNVGDPYVPDVFMFPPIRKKVRLTILDATIGQYEGGPSYIRRWFWHPNQLLAAMDPVALDRIGWEMIERKRKQAGLPGLKQAKREPRYILTAADAQHRLGVADRKSIRILEG